ncbi:hypothetical protein [Microbulbifer agarilyticus]|uniref:hypothetical protein n=1 Tax=Microbulbifer agarilyticus TaxID=260552 RepID=UPI0018DEC756|nr:hypothetical protein [Microbulbifer agarilyticus]
MYEPVDATFESALSWIQSKNLDAVICFNGRMDLTRAVTHACEQAGIPFVTHERTWFGDGLQLVPNANCLSLKALSEMVEQFDDKPLTHAQARIAGKLAGERFLQRNSLEWRLYNQNPEPAPWPLQPKGVKVLVLPSSKNEFAGHDEWKCEWEDNTQALDDLFKEFSIEPNQVVVRCHPNWAESIGRAVGDRSLQRYKKWTKEKGIYCISSEEKASTYDLIQQADVVVLNGGSSAVEAGVCGKQVICLGPSTYQAAGFVRVFRSRDELRSPSAHIDLDPETVVRKTLRFLYLRSHRFAQFVEYVRAVETTRYSYFEGGDPQRLVSMLVSGELKADDATYAQDTVGEDRVIEALRLKNWGELADYQIDRPMLQPLNVERRVGLRWIDGFRSRLPRGDRG